MSQVLPEKNDGCEVRLSMSNISSDQAIWLEKKSSRTEFLLSSSSPESDSIPVVPPPIP